jgi:hypothetical protein
MHHSFPTQAEAILHFYKTLRQDFEPPGGIAIMNPYLEPATWELTSAFYKKFYADAHPRIFIFGINPGRLGGGVTGIPFTDPLRLQEKCGIRNELKKLPELSSQFIYEMIDAYGGVKEFYQDVYMTALSPLGYTKDGRNLNYYDDKELLKTCEPFMAACIRRQLATIPALSSCFCLGEGENYKQFNRINGVYHFFEDIVTLPHPRWIMQYRRKRMKEYVGLYVDKIKTYK